MNSGTQNVAFPRKLYDLIESEPNELIEWSNRGDCFFIRDQDEFCAQVLSKYFRHTKLTSFQRQLNLYGFRRITKGPDTGAYSHPLFSRDDPSHVDTIKRVVRKGGNSSSNNSGKGRWNQRGKNISNHHGASPNSSHSFPDVIDVPSAFHKTQRQLSSSWPHHHSNSSKDDEEDSFEDEDDEDDEEYVGKAHQQGGNAYSKPYYTQSRNSSSSSSSNRQTLAVDVPNNNRRLHRYGTRGASYEEEGGDGEWGGYPHSAPSPSGFGGGDGMMVDTGGVPMPPPNNRYQAPLSPQQGAYSHPPHGYNQFLLPRGTSSDMVGDFSGGSGGGGGGGMIDGLGMAPKMARSTSAMSAELNVSLAGSDSWNLDGAGGAGLADLKDLDDLDQFYFENSFTDPTSPDASGFAMEM